MLNHQLVESYRIVVLVCAFPLILSLAFLLLESAPLSLNNTI